MDIDIFSGQERENALCWARHFRIKAAANGWTNSDAKQIHLLRFMKGRAQKWICDFFSRKDELNSISLEGVLARMVVYFERPGIQYLALSIAKEKKFDPENETAANYVWEKWAILEFAGVHEQGAIGYLEEGLCDLVGIQKSDFGSVKEFEEALENWQCRVFAEELREKGKKFPELKCEEPSDVLPAHYWLKDKKSKRIKKDKSKIVEDLEPITNVIITRRWQE